MTNLQAKLLTEHSELFLEPHIEALNYFFSFDNEGNLDVDSPACKNCRLDAVAVEKNGNRTIIGYAELRIINASRFEDDIFWQLDDEDGDAADAMSCFDDIEENYHKYGFYHPYCNFMVCTRLYVDPDWRKLGVASLSLKNTLAIFRNFLDMDDLSVLSWEAIPQENFEDYTQEPTKEDRKLLVEIYKKMGANHLRSFNHDHFYLNF